MSGAQSEGATGANDPGHPGRVYGPRAGAGGRSVRFEVFSDRIAARDPGGEAFTLHPGRTRVERSGGGISLEADDRSFALVVTDPEGLAALREDSPSDLRDAIAGALGAVKSARGRDRRWVLYSIILIALAGWGGYLGLIAAARSAVRELPISIDREIGDLAGEDLVPGASPIEDEAVVSALAEIVARLEPHAVLPGFDYRITVLDAEEVNAFALPGGRIFVLAGLIRAADSPDQVAGVLAHEMAHVTLRHGLRNLAQSLGLVVAVEVLVGDIGGLSVLAVEGVRHLVEQGYSRELEAEADAEGVRMLRAAAIDPRGLVRFFELLQGQEGADLPSWLSSHPDLADRIAEVERLAGGAGPVEAEPFSFDWGDVKRRVGE